VRLRQAVGRPGVSNAATELYTAPSKAFKRSYAGVTCWVGVLRRSGVRSNLDVIVDRRFRGGTEPTVAEYFPSGVYCDVVFL